MRKKIETRKKFGRICALVVVGMFIVMTSMSTSANDPDDWTMGGDSFNGTGEIKILGSLSSDSVSIIAGGQQGIIVSGAFNPGFVGIGLAYPSLPVNRLDVAGGMAVGGDFAGLSPAPSNGMIIQGWVGIGTADPHYPLEVVGDVWLNSDTIKMGDGTFYNKVQKDAKLSTGNYRIIIDENDDQTDRYFSVEKDEGKNDPQGSGTELMRCQENGNVGIATNAPTEKLDVNGRVRVRDLPIDNTLTYVVAADSTGVLHRRAASTIGVDADWYDVGNPGYPPDNINDNIYTYGNVGIGTASPDKELHVVGNIKMVDGNQGAGKVLTSDANGVGSWQAIAKQNLFETIDAPSGTDPVADNPTDTLQLIQEGIVTITGDAANDRITIDATEVDGSTTNELQNLFETMTDGTNNAVADSQTDVFKYRGGGIVSVAVANDDPTHGDNVLISATEVDGDTTNELQNLAEVYAHEGATGNAVQLTAANGDIQFSNDDAMEMLFLDESSGRIGIGTTNPANLLDVYDANSAIGADAVVGIRSADSNAYLKFSKGGATYSSWLQFDDPGQSARWMMGQLGGTYDFVIYSSAVNPFLHLDYATGNVGIGMATPSERLDVNGRVRVRDLPLDNNLDDIVVADSSGVLHTRDASTLDADGDWDYTTNPPHMFSLPTGNVGIGDSIPDAKLDILNTGAGASFRVDDSTDGDTTPFIIDSDGKVGIGTAIPDTKLHIVGSVKIVDGTQSNGYVLTCDGGGLASWQNKGVPTGVIVMWSGTLASVPSGWALCDGTSGTPDLRDKFIYGWTNGIDPGGTGGSISHSHTVDPHTHWVDPPEVTTGLADAEDTSLGCFIHEYEPRYTTDAHDHTVDIPGFSSGSASPGTSTENHLPPYYKLAFIMKL